MAVLEFEDIVPVLREVCKHLCREVYAGAKLVEEIHVNK